MFKIFVFIYTLDPTPKTTLTNTHVQNKYNVLAKCFLCNYTVVKTSNTRRANKGKEIVLLFLLYTTTCNAVLGLQSGAVIVNYFIKPCGPFSHRLLGKTHLWTKVFNIEYSSSPLCLKCPVV